MTNCAFDWELWRGVGTIEAGLMLSLNLMWVWDCAPSPPAAHLPWRPPLAHSDAVSPRATAAYRSGS